MDRRKTMYLCYCQVREAEAGQFLNSDDENPYLISFPLTGILIFSVSNETAILCIY